MVFAEFANILKEHFKKKISDEKLCGILFDAIIFPADLRNRHGEILTVDKAEISRIMNRKKNIPNALQEHVWDKEVQESLDKYFATQIVDKLVPDTSDLCYRLMKLIDNDSDISPPRKAEFRNTAERSAILFLKDAFVHAIRQKNKSARTTVNKPALKNEHSAARRNDIVIPHFDPKVINTIANVAALYHPIISSPAYQSLCRAMQSAPRFFEIKIAPTARRGLFT